jgi:hypothetical protein
MQYLIWCSILLATPLLSLGALALPDFRTVPVPGAGDAPAGIFRRRMAS